MQTGEDGKYTSNLSGCVTDVKALKQGFYVIVASTFNPQQLGKFSLAVYSNFPVEYQ